MEISQDTLVKCFEILGSQQVDVMTEVVVFPTMLRMKELGAQGRVRMFLHEVQCEEGC
ncbi:hypothetical protein DEO72_LG11g2266 [Vigna unguiculata]|uniref:Uncharacterized protein n=1 Tax=Vigna unguiculata TaxID=3917 RepID=A0A4D6NU18_VIGUN|nr:hypothetical protein DEO72_LG11g2266 [Vigna unguiculata]